MASFFYFQIMESTHSKTAYQATNFQDFLSPVEAGISILKYIQ